jgi:hypothetical protein
MAPVPRTARPSLRQLHIYLSFLVAPCLLFFAITGAFQTFRVPDEKTAPVLLQKLARVHRDDVFALKPPPPPKAEGARAKAAKPAAAPKPHTPLATTLVKWYFVAMSILMVTTTLIGLWMGLAYSRDRKILWLLLLAGAAVPALLLAL